MHNIQTYSNLIVWFRHSKMGKLWWSSLTLMIYAPTIHNYGRCQVTSNTCDMKPYKSIWLDLDNFFICETRFISLLFCNTPPHEGRLFGSIYFALVVLGHQMGPCPWIYMQYIILLRPTTACNKSLLRNVIPGAFFFWWGLLNKVLTIHWTVNSTPNTFILHKNWHQLDVWHFHRPFNPIDWILDNLKASSSIPIHSIGPLQGWTKRFYVSRRSLRYTGRELISNDNPYW